MKHYIFVSYFISKRCLKGTQIMKFTYLEVIQNLHFALNFDAVFLLRNDCDAVACRQMPIIS